MVSPHRGSVQRWAQKDAGVVLLPSDPAHSSSLSPTLSYSCICPHQWVLVSMMGSFSSC